MLKPHELGKEDLVVQSREYIESLLAIFSDNKPSLNKGEMIRAVCSHVFRKFGGNNHYSEVKKRINESASVMVNEMFEKWED